MSPFRNPHTSRPTVTILDFVRRHSSFCFAAAAMLIFFLCLRLLPAGNAEGSKQILGETIQQYGFVASDDQQWAHLIAVIAIGVFSAIGFFLSGRGVIADQKFRFVPRLGTTGCIALAALGLIFYRFFVPTLIVGLATAALLSLLLVVAVLHLRTPVVERATIALIGAYLVVLTVPGLFVSPIPLMEADPVSLAQFETHLFQLLGRGSALVSGQNFFEELPMYYGLLMPSIMSVVDMKQHGLSIAGQLRFVQVCQILFCLAAVAAYLAYRPRNYMGVLAALLLAGPYWAAAGLGIWHPNQTGFRSLGLAVGMLALVLVGRLRLERAVWWLGAIAGAAIVMNLETAIAVLAAFIVFLIVRTRTFPLKLLLQMAAAGALVIVAYLFIYSVVLGRFPFSMHSFDPLVSVKRFSGGSFGLRLFSAGYEGEGYYLVPFALLMFAHAAYVVIDGFRKLGRGPLPLRSALRVSVAVTLIVWLAYYFNAPNWWQIWTHLFLYGFLIIDVVERRRFGIGFLSAGESPGFRFTRIRTTPAILLMLFFLAMLIPHTNRHLLKYMAGFMYPGWISSVHEVSVLSGILMPKVEADLLERKARKLTELHAAAKGRLVYLTFNTAFTAQLTRLFQPGPYRDMFVEIPGELAFERVVDELLKRRPEVILIDAPTGPLALSGPRKDFQDRLRRAISLVYRVAETEDGWQIWRPSDSR